MPNKNIKVLMVDDDKMLLDMYSERLTLAGYKVTTSSNGEECLSKIHEIKPDIVLLDIMMPKVNGYDTLASIKSDPQTKDTPVIMLSALVRDINKSRAIESGADDYIIKSEVMPADVIKKIESVLAKYDKGGSPKEKPPVAPSNPQTPPEETAKPTSSPPEKPMEVQFEPTKNDNKNAAPAPKKSSSTFIFLGIVLVLVIAVAVFLFLTVLNK